MFFTTDTKVLLSENCYFKVAIHEIGHTVVPVHPYVGSMELKYDVLLDVAGQASGRGGPLSFPTSLKFDVLDSTGRVVGQESVRLLQKTGSYPWLP